MEIVSRQIAMNAVSSGSENRPKRFKDDNGFLHVFLRFMRTGTLDYTQATYTNGVPPEAVGSDGRITVLVEPEELDSPESLASLKGMPGLRGHEMATPEGEKDIVGSVAGEPEYVVEDGVGYVECEAVITDAETIRKLDDGALVEVSAGYHHDVVWEPGEFEGTPYAGKQKNLRYNHFVFLPEGEGRAGPGVKALNSKEKEEMSEPKKEGWFGVYSRKLKKMVYAQNADEAEEIAEADAEEKPAENQMAAPKATDGNPDGDGGEGPAEIKNLAKIMTEFEKVKARAAELEGQLQAAQEKINELMSVDTVEAEAEAITDEREEAATVVAENCGIDKAQAMNSFREQKLRGHALRVHAMNSIREHQGKPALDAEKVKDESFILGMWNGVKDTPAVKSKVIGGFAANAKAMNAVQDYKKSSLSALGFDVK